MNDDFAKTLKTYHVTYLTEIAEMGKNIKFDYYLEAVDLIYCSDKLTDSEKHRMVNNLIYGYTQNKFIDKNAFEYLKRKLS